jgi:hypothetical protein
MFGSAVYAADVGSTATFESVGVPQGFDELARDRDLLVDVYYGGRKVGETRVVAKPGFVRFKDPEQARDLVPNIETSAELSTAFSSELPTNAALLCAEGQTQGCGELAPQVAGVIFDEDRFRLNLFVNPNWLRVIRPQEDIYLATPIAPLALTTSNGLAISGSNDSAPTYNLQNRTVVGFRNARLLSESSYSSSYGLVTDTLVGQVDRPGMRYSAGLFWAPGTDLIGQRRIAGIGVGTQFDTRADRESLEGTPLVLFLGQPSRVDILVDGRLVSSGVYEAGNNILDTSTMPDGSYEITLRIHGDGGASHEERRFFAKNPQIAPVGQPIYFGYAGFLANTRENHAISISSDIFYQIGAARRLNEKIAVDVSAMGTRDNPIFEAGAWLLAPVGRLRAAALASVKGDKGALLEVQSGETGGLSLNFELRRLWSHDGQPLVPVSNHLNTFGSVPLDDSQLGNGSYMQASGSIGYRIGAAYLSVIGSLRKDDGLQMDYSVGPNLSWPLVNVHGLQIGLQADTQLTRTTTAGYVGVQMLFNRAGYAVANSFGGRSLSNKSGAARSRTVGDTTAHISYADDLGTDISVGGGVTREIDATTAHADGIVYSRFGSAHGEILHSVEGGKRTQYGLSVQTGAILSRTDAVVGGREPSQSAIVASVEGAQGGQFDVLVDGQPRGRLKAGDRIPIFLQPYRAYSVTLRPVGGPSVWFDTAAGDFTLYPGNVQHVSWRVEHVVTVFGRAVRPDGSPVANAMITSRRGVGQSNADGYFQVETVAKDLLAFNSANGAECKVSLGAVQANSDFARVGRVVCE